MSTHKVKLNTVAQMWDKPETGRTNKGQLQAGTQVTVSETRSFLGIGYSRLYSHNDWWTKSSWLMPMTISLPTGTTIPTTGEEELWQFTPSPNPREAAQKLGGAPDIVELSTGAGRTQMTKAWQLFLLLLNPNMAVNNVAGLLGTHKAFCNGTGFPTKPEEPRKANYFSNTSLDYPNPELDKDRSCAFNYCKGVVLSGELLITTLDGNSPPPDISAINPLTFPWLFFHCTIVKSDRRIRPFPNGAPAWGVNMNVVFFPLVATHPIFYPLNKLVRTDTIKLPYT